MKNMKWVLLASVVCGGLGGLYNGLRVGNIIAVLLEMLFGIVGWGILLSVICVPIFLYRDKKKARNQPGSFPKDI